MLMPKDMATTRQPRTTAWRKEPYVGAGGDDDDEDDDVDGDRPEEDEDDDDDSVGEAVWM